MRKLLLAGGVAATLALSALGVTSGAATGSQDTVNACITSTHTLTRVHLDTPVSCPSMQAVSWPVSIPPSPSPSPSPSPTATASPSPSPTGNVCTAQLGGNCGAYGYPKIPMSNGFDTYVSNQSVGPQPGTTETVTAVDPGNWSVTANAVPYGYGGVQSFPDVQQLTNDWCGSITNFATCNNPVDMPLASLNSLTVSYSETSPQDSNSMYEFAPDVWNDNYGSDVMFWADTHGRCNQGSYGGTILGTATFDGQTWTVNRYGGPGAEIIFVLDSDPNTPNSCAQQSSGSIDILAGFQWLVNNGYMTGLGTLAQLNTGWEITSADNTAFTMNSYSIGVS